MRSLLKSTHLFNQSIKSTVRKPITCPARYSSSSSTINAKSSTILLAGASTLAAGYYLYNQTLNPIRLDGKNQNAAQNISPKEFRAIKLKEIHEITHNTKLFRFELPEGEPLNTNIASCVLTKAIGQDGKPIIRPYTPTSDESALGHFDFVIKHYEKGAMSNHIFNLKVGDTLDIQGPIPKFSYTPNSLKEVGMVAGGTGITPMLQVIRKILNNPDDKTKVTLVFANRTINDILVKDVLDDYASKYPNRLKVHYILSNSDPAWKGQVGHINKDILTKYMPKSSDKDVMVYICGPDGMVASLSGPKNPDRSQGPVGGTFKELGYSSEQVYKF